MTLLQDLDTRSGLPEDWLFLLNQHPRCRWPGHKNLGALTEFWLSRHEGFREMGQSLDGLISEFREGLLKVQEFGSRFGPNLQRFLGELEHHHNVEDYHYFPIFTAAEKRLTAGFELLERDHDVIHQKMVMTVESANTLFGYVQSGDHDQARHAADD